MTSSGIQIGSPVVCGGTSCGAVTRIVINPTEHRFTHLVVSPRHGGGRLVPADCVRSAGDEIELTCTWAEFDAFPSDQDQELLSDGPQVTTGQRDDLGSTIFFEAVAPGIIGRQSLIPDPAPATRTFARVPDGEEALQPDEQVKATDGPVGHVSGVAVDLASQGITHLIVEAGHLWGKRQIAIPISDVEHIGISVQISLTKQQVSALEPS